MQRKTPSTTAGQIRQDAARIVRKAKPPKRNMPREEFAALKALKDNKNVLVLPADKGNATVIMDTVDYISKMRTLLNDSSYKHINTDPTTYLEKTTRSKIKQSPIDEDIQIHLIPREKSSRCPKLYGLPKVHKNDVPLRPIVSSIGSPTQHLAKYLASQLQPIANNAASYIRNTEHFIEMLGQVQISPEDLLVSFDVVSLFTNVPVGETLDIIRNKHKPPRHIVELSEHCLKNTYFTFNGTKYRQVKGAPMGSPLSPVVANIFM